MSVSCIKCKLYGYILGLLQSVSYAGSEVPLQHPSSRVSSQWHLTASYWDENVFRSQQFLPAPPELAGRDLLCSGFGEVKKLMLDAGARVTVVTEQWWAGSTSLSWGLQSVVSCGWIVCLSFLPCRVWRTLPKFWTWTCKARYCCACLNTYKGKKKSPVFQGCYVLGAPSDISTLIFFF